MALVVNTNVPSIASQRHLMESRREMESAMERLSSGQRINGAADDAAGLAISTRMDTQITGINMAIRNANDGISLTQTAEGAMDEVTNMLQRMRELALQAVHGANNDSDRASLDAEVQALKAEIDRVAETTTFNNQSILNGTFDRLFQIGAQSGETLRVSIGDLSTSGLGLFGAAEESSDPVNTLVGGRVADLSGVAFASGDIVINGQAVKAFASADDISDLVTKINQSVDNVEASAFNTVVAKSAGTGSVLANEVAIKVNSIGSVGDADYQAEREVFIEASSNMDELVANINKAFLNGEVVASKNSDGKLVLSNNTGSTISIVDESGTDGAYDGGTGFLVDEDGIGASTGNTAGTAVYTAGTSVRGFLKLASTDGSAITIENGNRDLGYSSIGSVTDINNIGFQKVIEDPDGSPYQVVGAALSSFTTIGKSSATGQADLTINGVAIYEQTLSDNSATFQGKLDLINAFSDDTGVVANAFYEKTFDMSNVRFVADRSFTINGVSVDFGATLDALKTNINTVTGTTGLTASVNGNNLTLRGEGVQNVNIANTTYDLATESTSTSQAAARRDTDTASGAQTVTIGSTAVVANRTFKLVVENGTGVILGTASTDITVYYSAAAGDSQTAVAEGLRDKLHLHMQSYGTWDTADFDTFVSATTGALSFNTAAQVGSAAITLSVVQVTADYQAFSGSVTGYGAIRLSSTEGTPISIELGEGSTEAEHGFKEMNVGDSTWDANATTYAPTATQSSAVSGLNVASSSAAESALDVIDGALQQVSDIRSSLGATENRLTHTVDNLSNVVENTSAAQSRILDADFALEAARLARAQVLQQAGTAMLAQANAAPQNVLSLLG